MPTIDGEVDLTLPKGLQPEDRKVMRRRGVQKLRSSSTDDRGDQWVTFKIQLPRHLTAKQKDMIQRAFANDLDTEPAPKEKPQETSQQPQTQQEDKDGLFSRAFKKIKEELCEDKKGSSSS